MTVKFKAAILIALLAIFMLLVLIPVKGYTLTQYPGYIVLGQYGDTCRCPHIDKIQCGCAMDLIPSE